MTLLKSNKPVENYILAMIVLVGGIGGAIALGLDSQSEQETVEPEIAGVSVEQSAGISGDEVTSGIVRSDVVEEGDGTTAYEIVVNAKTNGFSFNPQISGTTDNAVFIDINMERPYGLVNPVLTEYTITVQIDDLNNRELILTE